MYSRMLEQKHTVPKFSGFQGYICKKQASIFKFHNKAKTSLAATSAAHVLHSIGSAGAAITLDTSQAARIFFTSAIS